MSLYSIKHRFDDSVLFEMECDSLKLCIEAAVKSDANLASANLASANLASTNLTGADLTGADLSGASLVRADLTGADLLDANLAWANLAYANLAHANLVRADLTGADLTGADLLDANLARADLTGADLSGASLARANLARANLASANLAHADLTHATFELANLRGANLEYANLAHTHLAGAVNIPPFTLRATRADLFDVLLRAIPEVPALLTALREGRVDGSTYEGDCACLCGTIANARGISIDALDFKDPRRPIESWFFAIEKGDTPETNAAAKQAEKWIVEFMELVGIADRAGQDKGFI